MNELYELKDKLCRELKKYNEKEINASNLEHIKNLSKSIYYIEGIIEEGDEGYSGRSYGHYMNGRSYARNRDSRGRYTSRGYSRDGYSYDDEMIHELKEMMEDTSDERKKQELKHFIHKMESM